LHGNAWVDKVDLEQDFTMEHLSQFVELWWFIDNFQLNENVKEDIVWRLTLNGQYTAKSAYEVQFFGSTLSSLNKLVWKAWTR
jgi:hypothetical protein